MKRKTSRKVRSGFVLGWLRTNVPGQQVTALLCFNPPSNAEGQWLIDFFAPWLDPRHERPAVPGELRYFAMIDGKETEVLTVDPFEHEGPTGEKETIKPKSRTFFPARVEDNPVYMATGYRDMLAALPEPLRSQMLKGDFAAGIADNAWQVIPTAWARAAMERGQKTPRPVDKDGKPLPFDGLGADISAGGADRTVFAPRVDDWYAPLKVYQGIDTDDGAKAAALMIEAMEGAKLTPNIDIVGVGQGVKTAFKMQGVPFEPINGAASSYATDISGYLKMANLRAEYYWAMREALDPASGRNICLPYDRELLAELCAARWSLTAQGVLIEKKRRHCEAHRQVSR